VEIKKLSEAYNALFERKELSFYVDHPSSGSPQLDEVKKTLATVNNTAEDRVFVIKLKTKTGTNRTYGMAEIYGSSDIAEKVVPIYIQIRNSSKRHKENQRKT